MTFQNTYTHPYCKKEIRLKDEEEARDFYGRKKYMGLIESCLHYCPDNEVRGDVNNCKYFLENHE